MNIDSLPLDEHPKAKPLHSGRSFGPYLDRLSRLKTEIIVGIYEDGRRLVDVAKSLGITVDRAKRLHTRALEHLRKELCRVEED